MARLLRGCGKRCTGPFTARHAWWMIKHFHRRQRLQSPFFRKLGLLCFFAAVATAQETRRVIIILRDQPHREIAERVIDSWSARILDAEEDYKRLAEQPFTMSPIVESARSRRDSAIVDARREIVRQAEMLVGPAQASLTDRLARMAARRVRRYQIANLMAAEIPASAWSELERRPRWRR
jgi:hypothetical protein